MWFKFSYMKIKIIVILLFCSTSAQTQPFFTGNDELYNWRISDGAKEMVKAIDKVVHHPVKYSVDSMQHTRAYKFIMPSVFYAHSVFKQDSQYIMSFKVFFDQRGTYNNGGDVSKNVFGILGDDDPSFKNTGMNPGGWRFRLVSESNLIAFLNPKPNVVTYAGTTDNLYRKMADIPAADILNDIDSNGGVISATLKIPFNEPDQWHKYNDASTTYGIELVLRNRKTGKKEKYYIINMLDDVANNLLMKQIVNPCEKPMINAPINANTKYKWQITDGGKGIVDAVIDLIKNPVINTKGKYSCGSLPIIYLHPLVFDPECKPIKYKFQAMWDPSDQKVVPNSFNINVYARAGEGQADCMLPGLSLPCNYASILDGYSNQVWKCRLIQEDILKAFLKANDTLGPNTPSAYSATMLLPGVNIYTDINPKATISYYLDTFTGKYPNELIYYNEPFNSLGVKLVMKDKNNQTLVAYLVSDYDKSSTLLWRQLIRQK